MSRSTLIYTAVIVTVFALCVYLVGAFFLHKKERHLETIRLGEQAGVRVAQALDALLFSVSERATNYAREVGAMTNEEQLLGSIRRESLSMEVLMGVTVAFEPGAFPSRSRYAPFYNKSQDKFQFVEDTYDYTSTDLETAEWYTGVVAAREDKWSEPYYAEAAEAMVVDYGVPLYRTDGELIGVVDYTIRLTDFTRIVDSLSVGESGYGFTFDQEGAILTHPHAEYLLQSVFELGDGKDRHIINALKNQSEGVVGYNSTYTYNFSWFFFRRLESTGWKSVLVFSENDLLGYSDEGRRKIIQIAIGVSTLLMAILAFFFRIDQYNRSKLWWMVRASSLIITANIVFVWYLNLTTDFSQFETDQERIVNQSILDNYVKEFDRELYLSSQAEFTKVPTGLFIESFELTAFEASVIGKLWMKYPKSLVRVAPPAFYFPDVSAKEPRGLVSTRIGEVEKSDHVLVTWKFRATLEQDFSYQQFPFEQNDIQLVVLYPDFSRNILLVPDLDSYEILNPSVKPGLNEAMTVPSSETISTFFTFRNIDYATNFGDPAQRRSHPALRFSVVVKRNFLSPFIANMIPIMIVALMMFIVLYVSSNTKDGRSGLNPMNIVQGSAGFLFILLLAHVNERNRIETPEIAYIELFYFSMYVFITLQAIALAMLVRGTGWSLLRYQDNLVLKLSFWPALLSIWFAATLLRFY